MGVPGKWRRERLRFVVVLARGHRSPRRIARTHLRESRLEEEPKRERPHKEDGLPGRVLARATEHLCTSRRRDHERMERGLEKQSVPLVREELAPHGDEREVEEPETAERFPREKPGREREREHLPERAGAEERCIRSIKPEDRRESAEPSPS